MSHDKDRSQKRKAKLEARRKAARGKAAKALAKQPRGGELVWSGSGPHDMYITSRRGGLVPPEGVGGWPVVRACAPSPEVWTATGLGTAGVVRQGPDGSLVEVTFKLSARDGLDAVFGRADVASMAELFTEDPEIKESVPPFEPSTPSLAAQFIRGALALARHRGASFPGIEAYLAVVPRVPGNEQAWRDDLVGPGGRTPRELVQLLRALPDDAFSDSMEPMVITTPSFRVEDPEAIVEILAGSGPELELASRDEDEVVFHWTRPYPKGHWSPLAQLGGRQILGSVTVGGGALVAEAQTVSMAAKLMWTLRKLVGSSIRLRAVSWLDRTNQIRREIELP